MRIMDFMVEYGELLCLVILAIAAVVSLWYVRKSTLAAVTSASASETSTQPAEDALAEARRQHRAGIRPHLTACIEKFLKPNVGTYYALTVVNDRPGSAHNIKAILTTKAGKKIGQQTQVESTKTWTIASLGPRGRWRLLEVHESGRYDDVCGTIVCQDTEGNHYWFRRKGWSDGWEWGEGDPPPPEASHADS